MVRRWGDPGSASMLAGRPRELWPWQPGEAGSRTSHKCKTELILTLTEPKEEEYKKWWMLITSMSSRLQQTKVLLKLREREGKRKSKWTNSLYCCKSSCYSDITKKLNLKQDRVNLVNLLFWFLETAKNMYLIGGLEAESESDVDINTSSLKCILQEIWQFDGLSWWWHYLLWWYGCWYFW